MTLFWRAWATIMLVNLVVLALFVGLATLRYAGIDGGLTGERLGVLAQRTAEPFAIAAGLGLALGQVRNAPAVLERSRQTDERIDAIHVFEPDGRVVHSTRPEAPARISQELVRRHRSSAGTPWFLESSDRFISGVSIDGGADSTAGGVLLVYQRRHSQTRVLAMSAELSMLALLVWLTAAVVGWFPLRLALAREVDDCRRLEQTIDAFERRGWRPGGVAFAQENDRQPREGELAGLLDAAERRYHDACRSLPPSAEEGRG
ncbi:hypothetical protein [Halomonas sp.]|uniref:hypothetical protein n=1 Tax=Halomonas sp. TaxID=1486246 RepID=UPI00298D9501|nr:hypothetical protein [Halomonas sp.]MDW7747812.1 hypothetical protein [Halomonas sp.]